MRQGLNGIPCRRSHFGLLASCIAAALALVAPRVMGQCTLSSAVNFGAGKAPGPTLPPAFMAGFENDVPVYTSSSGARRLLLMFNYGYGVMDLSNPSRPSAAAYADMRTNIPPVGDGQNYVTSMGVAPGGERAVFSLGPQAGSWEAVVGTALGYTFDLSGDFAAGQATGGVVVQKTGDGRYIAYALVNRLVAANITTLGALTPGSIPSESSVFPGGGSLQLAGNYLSYLSNGSVLILDASNPGSSPPNITAGFTRTTLSALDFGRSSDGLVSLATAVDPANSSALYVLVEYSGSSHGYSLMRVQGSTKTLIGSFSIPSLQGEQWGTAYTSALITGGSNVYVFMWANRSAPKTLYRLYSTTVLSFGSTPGAIDFDPAAAAYRQLSVGYPMRGFASADGTVNAYLATSMTAYALSLACTDVTASNNGPVCAGTPLTLTSTGAASATYAWSGPNGFTASVQNPTIATPTAAASGVYQVTRTYLGTNTTAQTAATVSPPPIVPTAGNNGPLCAGQALALTAATVSGATFGWTGPNGYTSPLQNPTISNVTTAATGTYTVTATVNGCSNAASTGVTVNVPPPAPTAGNSGPLCAGGTLNLTASTIANAAYAWTGPNGFTSASQNPSIPNVTAAAAGVYSVTATVNGCTGPSGTTTAVNGPSALITAPSRICLSGGGFGAASVPNAGAGATYVWSITNGTITGGQGTAAITFSVTDIGTTTLGVTVTLDSCAPTGATAVAVSATCAPSPFITVPSCRAIDTRKPAAALGGPALAADQQRLFALAGTCGIPPSAVAVAGIVTATDATAAGSLTLFPGSGTPPTVNGISFRIGSARANNLIVPLSSDGMAAFSVHNFSTGTVNFVFDVNGYFQ